MNMTSILPRRWRAKQEATRHNEAIAEVLSTPPIVPKADGVVLFSMIGTAVLLPYLVAVKSLWHELRRGRVAILDDGTLTAQDRAVLAHHCGDLHIRGGKRLVQKEQSRIRREGAGEPDPLLLPSGQLRRLAPCQI